VALAKAERFDEASDVLLQAAEAGSEHAMFYLGEMSADSENFEEAKSWYIRAAELGHEEAKSKLAKFES
jgi:TPR repeat protein